MKIILDFDDQSNKYNALPRLLELKKILPNLKVNLFTIPFETSDELAKETKKYDWIKMIPHGYKHDSNYEFSRLNYEEAHNLMMRINLHGVYEKGFKAPGWQISIDTMRVLQNLGYWLAVQWSDGRFEGDVNGPYQPKVLPGLKFYALNEVKEPYRAIHGHTWDTCGNGLEQLWPELIKLPQDTEFVFISDYLETL